MEVYLKSKEEIEILYQANQIVAKILKRIKEKAKPGISTWQLNRLAEKLCNKYNVLSAFKGYKDFPCALCTSINHEVVHGIPSKKRILKDGDILSIDFGVIYKGFYGDSAITIPIGTISEQAKELLKVTEKALYIGIEKAIVNNTLNDIGSAIQNYVESKGFSVVRGFTGHGVGRSLHEKPIVPNYAIEKNDTKLINGMIIAIEPMVNIGTYAVEKGSDGWVQMTKDRQLSAHFEHSIAITSNGTFILSL